MHPHDHPIITLTTDFGTKDGYAGAMTGVILSQCPAAQVVAVTHDVPPQNIRAGGWALRNAWSWFPPGTAHVVVVDPGVGSARRGILARAGGHTFIGPDNGIIAEAVRGTTIDAARELTNPAARAKRPSATFHGRDIFAWAAGWIAAGNEPSAVGPPIPPSELVRLPDDSPRIAGEGDRIIVTGGVILADRFGNLITTITEELVERYWRDAPPSVFVGERRVSFGKTFSDVPPGRAVAYWGSAGFLEVAVNQGSAADMFGERPEIRLMFGR